MLVAGKGLDGEPTHRHRHCWQATAGIR